MQYRFYLIILSLLVLAGCERKSVYPENLRLAGWDYAWMQQVKKRLEKGDPDFHPALEHLISQADAALDERVYSVTFKEITPPGGTKNDYMSMGPYWWPDPEKPDGLPYIRRDGEVNPERDKLDSHQLGNMINAVRNLSLTWFFTGKEEYAKKASGLLRVWFLDKETLMNPHLEYAQAIPGRNNGRFIGIIDGRSFYVLMDAIALLEISGAMTEEDKNSIRLWFSEYFRWLTQSRFGKEEEDYVNNHSVAYDVQSCGIAYFLGDDEFVKNKVGEMPRRRIDHMIEEDGSQPHELIRTNAFGYSVSNMKNFFDAGFTGMKTGVDIFRYVNPKGGSLQKALDYLISYIGREEEWPYEQIADWTQTENNLGLIIRRAALIYNNETYRKLWKDSFYERAKNNWCLLVEPEKHQPE